MRFFNFFHAYMVQKYQNESAPIFYYGKSPKTNRKHLKIPNLQALTLSHIIKMTLYLPTSRRELKPFWTMFVICVLPLDGGQNKLLAVMFIHDLASDDSDNSDNNNKPGGCKSGVIIGRVDFVNENRDNVEMFLNQIKLFEFLKKLPENRYHIIGDLKMCNILTGQQGHGCKHPCFVCDGYRQDQHGRCPAGEEGRWITGQYRSLLTAFLDYNGWRAHGAVLRNAMFFNNHVREPIRLHVREDKPFHEYIKIGTTQWNKNQNLFYTSG